MRTDAAARDWAMQLYRQSILKQQKHHALTAMIGNPAGRRCLDIGGDNGVISLLLRAPGGRWSSADLDAHTVEAIRCLVGADVVQIVGGSLPYPDNTFDLVVIVDLLEHVDDDRGFVRECARVLKPDGRLIVNVPHVKRLSLLRGLRLRLGLTDAKHGHVRPGYTLRTLDAVLAPDFAIEKHRTYCRTFSEFVDIVLNAAYEWRAHGWRNATRSFKGPVVTQNEWQKHRKELRLLKLSYPFLLGFTRLDALLPFSTGYRLVVRAQRKPPTTSRPRRIDTAHAETIT